MKKTFLGAIALAAISGSALAADLPKSVYKAPIARATYSWSGAYVGANAGGAWGTFHATTTTDFNPAPLGGPPVYNISNPPEDVAALAAVGAQNIKGTAFTGGGQVGYNWQSGAMVLGVEADINYFHLSGSATRTGPYPPFPPATMTVNSQVSTDWLLTARPRIGFASDNWLFYVTGGLALTRLNGTFAFTDTLGNALETGSFANIKAGWTIGGGIEVGLWERWTVKAEYLYVDFGSVSTTSNNLVALGQPFPANVFHHSTDLKASIARLGLNYRL